MFDDQLSCQPYQYISRWKQSDGAFLKKKIFLFLTESKRLSQLDEQKSIQKDDNCTVETRNYNTRRIACFIL